MEEPTPVRPAIEETLTTSPSPIAFSSGAKARIGGELAAPVDLEHLVDQLVVQRVEVGVRDRPW